ncbi:MAG: hypothetical protein A2148_11485 [Chloroflexi bacterium RBG_16_68_14]|nr:MAG: hypothetical protein A2148_11485 [Chloroflexi bacterium RBG_16_68_14]
MKGSEALRLAVRELADPACRRCRGAGVTGADLIGDLCPCVRRRAALDDAGDEAQQGGAGAADEETSRAWEAIIRRARRIQAAALLGAAPEQWSG